MSSAYSFLSRERIIQKFKTKGHSAFFSRIPTTAGCHVFTIVQILLLELGSGLKLTNKYDSGFGT
jgi:hypothetical protein